MPSVENSSRHCSNGGLVSLPKTELNLLLVLPLLVLALQAPAALHSLHIAADSTDANHKAWSVTC